MVKNFGIFTTNRPKRSKSVFFGQSASFVTFKRVPEQYLKHLEGTEGLYEIRVSSGNNIFRIFCFFDEGQLVILLNGFQKKSQKTPTDELEKAKKLKKQYYDDKKKQTR